MAEGFIYATDPQGQLHKAPAGTTLPKGWAQAEAPAEAAAGGAGDGQGGFLHQTLQRYKGSFDPFAQIRGINQAISGGIKGLKSDPQTGKFDWKGQGGAQFKAMAKDYKEHPANLVGDVAAMATMGKLGHESPTMLDSLNRIKSGSYSDALAELEKYRKTVNEDPNKTQRINAAEIHAALTERMDFEWNHLYSKLQSSPTDALAIRDALKKLAKVDPMVAKWVENNVGESASGASVMVPAWTKVRELSKQMNETIVEEGVDRTIKAETLDAHKTIEDLLKSSADKQGVGKQYQRAYGLTRKIANIKHHTAFRHIPLKPSPMWGLGGVALGIYASGGMGLSGELGSAFIGKMVGEAVGKAVTPKGRIRVPELSRAGEAAVWKELGEKPPSGTGKKIAQSGKITHWTKPPGGEPKPAPAPVPEGGLGPGDPSAKATMERGLRAQGISHPSIPAPPPPF